MRNAIPTESKSLRQFSWTLFSIHSKCLLKITSFFSLSKGSLVLPLPGKNKPALEWEMQLLIFDSRWWTIFVGRQIRKPSIPAHWCRNPAHRALRCGVPQGLGAGSGGLHLPIEVHSSRDRTGFWGGGNPQPRMGSANALFPVEDLIPCERLLLL